MSWSSDDMGDVDIEIFDGTEIFIKESNTTIDFHSIDIRINKLINYVCKFVLIESGRNEIVMERILTELNEITSSEKGMIMLPSKDDSNFKCLAYASEAKQEEFDFDNIIKYSFTNKKIVISLDMQKDSRVGKIDKDEKTIMVVPITFRGDCNGCMVLSNGKYSMDMFEVIKPIIEIIGRLVYTSVNFETAATAIRKHSTLSKTQDLFLGMMSHELRTPLNGIVGMISMFSEAGPVNSKQAEYINHMTNCAVSLTNMLNNILDFAKLSSGKLTICSEPIDILSIVNNAVAIIEGQAKSKNLSLIVNIPPPENVPELLGDPDRITQVLLNLLVNAVKYTEQGYIRLDFSLKNILKQKYNQKWKLSFTVDDSGIGIPYDEMDNIFRAFDQGKAHKHSKGAGLGLPIVKLILELMDGTIKVTSSGISGKGSKFHVDFILNENVQVEKEDRSFLKGLKVLVVDDRSEQRLILSDILYSWGCVPTVFPSAEEAIHFLSHGKNDIQIALIDVDMPYMTGIELAQRMKSIAPNIPSFGLSSVDNGGECYFDAYMRKPIEKMKLCSTILNLIKTPKKKKRFSIKKKRKEKKSKQPKILIAEDDNFNAYTIQEMLKSIGIPKSNIKHVCDGQECVIEAKKNKYDIILMDIFMPIMDGKEAARHIRLMKDPPILVAVSASVQKMDRELCQKIGFTNFLSKPFPKQDLISVLRPFLN